MKMQFHPPANQQNAFQLREFITIVAVVALLAAVQLTSLADGRTGSLAEQCRGNMRRLAQAWLLYADDNDGRLVPNNGNTAGSRQTWVNGWLDFGVSLDNFNTNYLVNPESGGGMYGLLGPYLQRDHTVFRCPADTSKATAFGQTRNRVRSVSMNSWMGGDAYCGMSQYVQYRQLSEVGTPAMRMVVTEETEQGINDCWFAMRMEPANGGWLVDFPGYYHNSGAWYTFADGHVEYRRLIDPRSMPPVNPSVNIPLQIPMSPANPDVAWLQERTTERR